MIYTNDLIFKMEQTIDSNRCETLIDSIDQLIERDQLFTKKTNNAEEQILTSLRHLAKEVSYISEKFKQAEYLQGKTIDEITDLKTTVGALETSVLGMGGKLEDESVSMETRTSVACQSCEIF